MTEIVKPGLFGNFGPATLTKFVVPDCREITPTIEDARLGIVVVVKAAKATNNNAGNRFRLARKIAVKFFMLVLNE
ncbi:MAG: hypothetical protein AAB401_05260 [Acidobacteriota bacterium]